MKAFIIFVTILFLMLGAAAGWYYNLRMNRIESRGASLSLEKSFEPEEVERLLERYNGIIDREEVLLPALQKHDLVSYYELDSEEAALAQFREDTFVSLPGKATLHVLFNGKRKTRKFRDAVSMTLAKDFVEGVRSADFNGN